MNLELTLAISRLMNGEDPDELADELGPWVVNEAISVLESRV